MARLLLLLFSLFISFSSYSSDTVPKGTNVICNIYDAGISAKFKQRSDCEPYVPASTLSACTSNPFWTNSGYYCNQPGGAKKLIGISIIPSSECPYTHPVDLGNGYCGKPEEPEPEPDPHSCPDAGTFVHKTWGREGLNGWSTCRSDNCVVVAQVEGHSSMPSGVCYVNEAGKRICRYDLFYTGQACNFDPNKPGVNPPDHEYPDEPVTPPDTENPPSPDLPDEGGDIEPPIYDPDGEGDGKPDDPVQPPNPDPKPDPDDPNLSDGDNAVVGELSEANQRLENIDHTTQELTNTIKSDNDSLLEYQAHLLGEMKQMNQQLADGVGGGGGGGGNGDGDGDGSCEGEDCTPVAFPGAPEVVDPFAEILDETDINDILTRTAEVKTEIQTQMNNFKGLFKVPDYGTGGNIAPVEFDLNHNSTTIPVKFGIFGDISEDISAIIIMIAAFIAFLIVTTRR